MVTSTLGVELDAAMRNRLEEAASRLERHPRWGIEQALLHYLEQVESDTQPHDAEPPPQASPDHTAEVTPVTGKGRSDPPSRAAHRRETA